MLSEVAKKVAREVIDIFINAEIQNLPRRDEIEEEFEIIDKVYVTIEMIEQVEADLALYLDSKWPDYNHYDNLLQQIWCKRSHFRAKISTQT